MIVRHALYQAKRDRSCEKTSAHVANHPKRKITAILPILDCDKGTYCQLHYSIQPCLKINKSTRILTFADDVNMTTERKETWKRSSSYLKRQQDKWVYTERIERSHLLQNCSIGSHNFESLNEFVYAGSQIINNNNNNAMPK